MSIKKPVKKVIKKSLEVGEEFVKEAKKQITAKVPAAEERLGSGPVIGQNQAQKIQQREEEELGKVRMEKAKMLAEWRQRREQMKRGIQAIVQQREWEKEEGRKREEEEKKEKEKEKPVSSGEEAIAATGSTKKRPLGLFGLGKSKKRFKWSTAERKGRAPK